MVPLESTPNSGANTPDSMLRVTTKFVHALAEEHTNQPLPSTTNPDNTLSPRPEDYEELSSRFFS